MRIELIIEVEVAGNTGLHQHGFARHVLVTLDCGHQLKMNWYQAGDTPDGRAVRFEGGQTDNYPEEGTECHCYECRSTREELHPCVPSVRQVMAWLCGGSAFWGCVSAAQVLLGVNDVEWYADFDRS
jgi:hypothetical protein